MKPILFNTDMVRAILAERKSVTRRVVKPQFALDADGKEHAFGDVEGNMFLWADKPNIKTVIHPPHRPGDILYVRETWEKVGDRYFYRADGDCQWVKKPTGGYSEGWNFLGWHPSIHMPKVAARLFLRVTDVRVERLQNITLEDIAQEGIFDACGGDDFMRCTAYSFFENEWNSTIKKADLPIYGWTANPWVWVIEFERISKEAAPSEEVK